MTLSMFDTSIRTVPGAVIIDLTGEINSLAEQALNSAYEAAEAMGNDHIILNFTGVHYINSTGIALIVSLLSRARKANRQLVVYGLSDHYQEIFQITRLADYIAIHPDEASALQEVGA